MGFVCQLDTEEYVKSFGEIIGTTEHYISAFYGNQILKGGE